MCIRDSVHVGSEVWRAMDDGGFSACPVCPACEDEDDVETASASSCTTGEHSYNANGELSEGMSDRAPSF